jgi:hypothetical protein
VEVSEEIYKIDKFQDIVKRFDILIDNVKNWYDEDLTHKLIPNLNYIINEQELFIDSPINSNICFSKVY